PDTCADHRDGLFRTPTSRTSRDGTSHAPRREAWCGSRDTRPRDWRLVPHRSVVADMMDIDNGRDSWTTLALAATGLQLGVTPFPPPDGVEVQVVREGAQPRDFLGGVGWQRDHANFLARQFYY